MTMEMPEVMSKVIHDFIRPVEWFETTETTRTPDVYDDNIIDTRRWGTELWANKYYFHLYKKLEVSNDIIKIAIKHYKFINGRKKMEYENYSIKQECLCCWNDYFITDETERCAACGEHVCEDCMTDVGGYLICQCCVSDDEEEEDE